MRKNLPNPIELKAHSYNDLQLFLKRMLQIFPVLESRLEVEQFLVQVPLGLAQMVTKETLIAASRKQPAKAFSASLARAKFWAWNFFLDDLIEHPDDSLSNRAERFVVTYRKTSRLPRKRKTGTCEERFTALAYYLCRKDFEPFFQRKPPKLTHLPGPERKKFVEATIGQGYGERDRSKILRDYNETKLQKWKRAVIRRAPQNLDVRWLKIGQKFPGFYPSDIKELASRRAAIKAISRIQNRTRWSVERDIKIGEKKWPRDKVDQLQKSWERQQHDPEACQVISCLFHSDNRPPSSTP